ncbi:glycosyltransferase [Fibrella sp. HMF5335]|uniref:Glycosyltransferase n=1 Tax=Fibrella rubiginis TaxID=2817060 RepID=A0A939GDR1_9BACT|nr:glycosyltransferase [Fibrella rubiginis]MBO0934965.1 glycosyltransferase [Fibrella rubiginis]
MHLFYPIGTFYPAQSGGPSNSVYWLAKALVRQGVNVTVLSTDTDQPDNTLRNQWLTTEAGRVRYVSTRHHNLPWRSIWQSWQLIPTVDLVHLTSLFYPLSLAAAVMAIRHQKPLVWSPRGELAPAALALRPWLKQLVLKGIRPWASRITFHATSREEMRQIRTHFGPDVRVVELPNYLELPPLLPPSVPGALPPYLLYLGRLHPIKALDRLLEAVALSAVFRNGPWQLRLVGTDASGYGATLRQQADALGLGHRVSIEPPVASEIKQRILADAHALVLPSHSENFGNVVIEALAQGTPVVASLGTPWSILPAEGAGFWVANDPATLAATLDTCLSLPTGKYAQYRQRAIALATAQFDIRTNGHRWLSTYTALTTNQLTTPLCVE